jgi:hypothetical protein
MWTRALIVIAATLVVAAPIALTADTTVELERYGRIFAHSSAGNQLEYRGLQGRWRSYRLRFVLRTAAPAEAQRLAQRWQTQFCSPELRQLLRGLKVRRITGVLEGAASTPVLAECR